MEMEEVDKGCLMNRMGVSGCMFLLLPAYPASPERMCACVCVSPVDTRINEMR